MGVLTKRAFSMVEMMVAVMIMTLIMGGVTVAFVRMNEALDDTRKGTDLTNSSRGLFQLLSQDISSAGRGFNDLTGFEMRYNLNTSFGSGGDQGMLYGISDVSHDGAFSSFTLNWFNFDLTGGAATKHPSFVVHNPDGLGAGTSIDWLNFYSNDQTLLGEVEVGDVFVIYRFDTLKMTDELTEANPWNDVNFDAANDAMIAEVASITPPLVTPDGAEESVLTYQSTVTFGGSVFLDSYSFDPVETVMPEIGTFENNVAAKMRDTSDGDSKNPAYFPPKSVFIARRLGSAKDFNRVSYYVDQTGSSNALIRERNGFVEIVAIGITKFDVLVGIDGVPGVAPGSMVYGQNDGNISILDEDQWVRSGAEWGVSGGDWETLIGRHAQSLWIQMEMEGQSVQTTAAGSQDARKKRGFSEIFRLKNPLPVPSL